ncbi:MAG: ABC transporter permease [Planctomycetes bacterium]|nr:ABC transporter permease [Planctomycetota bacterium]
MKLLSVIKKSFREQIRSFWVLLLTVTMAPFFVFVYYLINESWQPSYELLVVNLDVGVESTGTPINHGQDLLAIANALKNDSLMIPVAVKQVANREKAMQKLQNKKADALVVIPENFSRAMVEILTTGSGPQSQLELVGDLTDLNYMVTAIWASEVFNRYLTQVSPIALPVGITETSLGVSGEIDEFDLWVPGLLILSIIMLMFTATIAIITEVENGTIIRLKLSRIGVLNFLGGITVVQVIVGLMAIMLTLSAAVLMGFNYTGSIGTLLVIAVLTSISMIAFSLILAAAVKSVNEVLVVGNFPMFLFMFFTGAAFPMEGKVFFHIAGYEVTAQGIMSPTHAVTAANKVLIMGADLGDVLPELSALVALIVIYWVLGAWLFYHRHMRVT